MVFCPTQGTVRQLGSVVFQRRGAPIRWVSAVPVRHYCHSETQTALQSANLVWNPIARVLIVGSGGLLGRALQHAFADSELLAWTRRDCDITQPETPDRIARAAPDVVINAAAWTDVDGAENPRHWPQVQRVNCEGVAHVLQGCEGAGARLVHISTNEVFPGEPGAYYAEYDPTGPVNAYGRSKAAGEALLASSRHRHLLVRVSWLFGPDGDHFPARITRAADRLPTLKVVDDEFGCPTYTVDAARRIHQLVHQEAAGIFHVVNAGIVSRYAWACQVLQATGRTATAVHPIPGHAWERAAPVPRHAVLVDRRMKAMQLAPLPPWQEALERLVARAEPWVTRRGM